MTESMEIVSTASGRLAFRIYVASSFDTPDLRVPEDLFVSRSVSVAQYILRQSTLQLLYNCIRMADRFPSN